MKQIALCLLEYPEVSQLPKQVAAPPPPRPPPPHTHPAKTTAVDTDSNLNTGKQQRGWKESYSTDSEQRSFFYSFFFGFYKQDGF